MAGYPVTKYPFLETQKIKKKKFGCSYYPVQEMFGVTGVFSKYILDTRIPVCSTRDKTQK